ncbi:DUF2332 domain-containing protein [Actinomadura macrotermitis]|uniref:DUF2332 domain-containing protein n=1 Tax=Actinomadura macrotermitis TaxID=2585200 RepID=A0A7K0BV28_9ACTN|nr:DUF2332 domain-containing protein [Actinomadura macrotermitis]MQY05039.1 hypothetical protein [Actinomadura macrotermitis]
MTELLALGMRYHAHECGRLGSPLYAELLAAAADDVEAGGPVAALFEGPEPELSSVPALRMMRAVHWLVLAGRAPKLAPYFPSAGGAEGPAGAWPAMRRLLAERPAEVAELTGLPLQTNEVGRSAALYGGLIRAVDRGPSAEVRLLEIGASAGLNLWPDRYAYEVGRRVLGDPGSPVRLREPWEGLPAGTSATPVIVARAGCDPHPLDPRSADGGLALLSCIWPDQRERWERARRAVDLARDLPFAVTRSGAADWLADRLAEPAQPGVTTVVWHSLVWQYIPASEQVEVEKLLEAAGARATGGAPLVRMTLEPDTQARYRLELQRWPGGGRDVAADSEDHGLPCVWRTPPAW